MVCDLLNDLLDNRESIAFIPKYEIMYKNAGCDNKVLKPLFTGYVFVRSNHNSNSFIIMSSPILILSKYIIKLLKKNSLNNISLSVAEKNNIIQLCDDQYIIKKSIGFIVGDKIKIISGSLLGYESIIKKIDRHKRRAWVELKFFNEHRQICLPLEIVKKVR